MTTSPLNPNLRGTITLLTSTLHDLGRDLPEALTAAIAEADAAAQVPRDLMPDPERAAQRWFELRRAGEDPINDPEIADLLTRNWQTIGSVEDHLRRFADDHKAAAVADAAGDIVEALREVVAEAQEPITEAQDAIGDRITRADTGGLSPDGARQHARAREAFSRVDLARRAWVLLAKHTGAATWRPETAEELLILSDLDLDAMFAIDQRVRRAKRDPGTAPRVEAYDARTIVAAGHPLDLATFEEFRTRLATVTAQAQRERDADARKRSPREHDGIDPVGTPVRAWVDATY
ncbi:hypothetical protein ACFVDI_14200 [Nocardioides sp. NPDC057767]|uniref:hypothetical protein n=1 Tax=unclassified Nocardioides TaxID=2615069 RepID=UPI00366D5679